MSEPEDDKVARALRALGDEPAEVKDLEAAWPGVVARARAEAERRERSMRTRRLLVVVVLVAILAALAFTFMKHDAPPPAPPAPPAPPPTRPVERAPLPELKTPEDLVALLDAIGATAEQRKEISELTDVPLGRHGSLGSEPPTPPTRSAPDPKLRERIDALLTDEQRAKLDAYCAKKKR